MKDTILFDLDGTLTDPGEGITNSVAYALARYGITVDDRSTLNCFIGPPLGESFAKYYHLSEEESRRAVDIYREYFAVKGIFENRLYDGIFKMLKTLKKAGKTLFLATSKPEVYAKQILDHFNLSQFFTFVGGSELDHRRVDKYEVIEYVLSSQRADRSRCVMVGDRLHDVIGAKKSGLESIGVTYGYGSQKELEAAGADHILPNVPLLTEFLLSL